MRQRIHIDLINLPHPSAQAAFLPLLQSAIRQERQVQMTYQMSNGAMLEARVAPLGLVARGSLWYLVASYEKQGNRAMGVYRVTRIQAAQITASLVNRPKNFDLAACWEELFAALMRERNQYQVTAHIHCSLLPRVRCNGRVATSGQDSAPPTSTEWRAVVLCFDTAEEACEYLLAFGPKVEVIAPLALREMVYTRALALAIRYAPTAPSPNAVLR